MNQYPTKEQLEDIPELTPEELKRAKRVPKEKRERLKRGQSGSYGLEESTATGNVTRFEVIDEQGRAYVRYDVGVTLSYQDDGRTLKVFIKKKGD